MPPRRAQRQTTETPEYLVGEVTSRRIHHEHGTPTTERVYIVSLNPAKAAEGNSAI